MAKLNPDAAAYADRLRVRACGICIQNEKLLLVRHGSTVDNSAFWAPPGGGVDYGETLHSCLKRELVEETGLKVEIGKFLFTNEFLRPPLHALELFFEVHVTGGSLFTGADPEMGTGKQLLEEVAWLALPEIQAIPQQDKHRALHYLLSLDDLLGLDHYFVG
ncbi:ADP-ribose pyrophosphatase YjhB (NUDIX family) [Pontibacter ummariensis]|uniref:ADP-ribose pyrophosphatase YjhB, NUDIX family n=1 Tax=Pontibacter ummariensis TaxID=1610492 RepID=A0A239C4P4_9BACT|nr:NUDIX hydrolase [Pontibacter ummariensis]PRY15443.1 ADP-ribose pyrophosphatase YjhB (NUDIX family) [Pontibacter ummariensis]SNS15225.1 ADP-ribose pyrophosphatase YjhB, NUDIX family [Pontibacter ummariensis]